MTQTSASVLPAPVAEDVCAVDAVIRRRLGSEVVLTNQIDEYIIGADGERLRSVILLLVANTLGYEGEHQRKLVVVVEFIHTATLLHDDVIDESGLCRGRKTTNAVFGNAANVLVGDFLYSCTFQMMVRVNSMHIMQVLADATSIISEDETLQLLNMHDPGVTEECHLQAIRYKIAKLLEAAAQIDAMFSDADAATGETAAGYGRRIDTAFQIVDNLLDYTFTADQMGKNAGNDLREGKPTLPLIYLLSNGTEKQRALVRQVIEQGGTEHFSVVFAAIQTSGALEYTHQATERGAAAAEVAASVLPPPLFRQTLTDLYAFSLQHQS